MLRLKNIKIESKRAEADFYPEDSNEAGHVVVDLLRGEFISHTDVIGYGESYRGHALQRLMQMAKEKDSRTECLVMWY